MRCPRFMHKHRHVQLEINCVLGMRGGDCRILEIVVSLNRGTPIDPNIL